LDMGTDIDIARDHTSADAEREVGAETGLDFASQGDGGLSVARLHDLCTHDSSARDGSSCMIIAATQRDCDKRDRKATGTPQLAFAGSLIDFGFVRSMMVHSRSTRWRGDNNSPNASAAGRAETGWTSRAGF
jgi:hypothetical protein